MSTKGPLPTKKAELRRAMRVNLRATTPEERTAWSAAIVRALCDHSDWASPGGVVAVFGGLPTEPDLLPLLPWLTGRGVRVALFAIDHEVMTPFLVRDERDIVAGQMGVWEPMQAAERRLEVRALSTVLVPGLAFSPGNGARLGRGKGHYDRALAEAGANCRRIGVCFHLQLQPSLPREPHDVAVEAIATESGWHDVPM